MAKEWVDYALSKSRDAESKLATSDKALSEAKKKYKESLFCLAEARSGRNSAKAALDRAERQAEKLMVLLRKSNEQLSLVKEQIKLQTKELGKKDVEREKVEQAAYDAGMNKTTQSFTA